MQLVQRNVADPVGGILKLHGKAVAAGGHGAQPITASTATASNNAPVAAQRNGELSNHHFRLSIPKPSPD